MTLHEDLEVNVNTSEILGLRFPSTDVLTARLKQLDDEQFCRNDDESSVVLAKKWLEFCFYTFGEYTMTMSVARIPVDDSSAATIFEHTTKCITFLAHHGFIVLCTDKDGANINRSEIKARASIRASEFGVFASRPGFKGSDDDIKVAIKHPGFPDLVVFELLDIVHCCKSQVTAIELSGSDSRKENRVLTIDYAMPPHGTVNDLANAQLCDGTGEKQSFEIRWAHVVTEWDKAAAAPIGCESIHLQTDFARKLSYDITRPTKWSRMCVGKRMKVCSATVSRHFKGKNPALSCYTGAVNDLMDLFNGHIGSSRRIRFGAISAANMGPVERIEAIIGQFLDWKYQQRATPLHYLHPATHSVLLQSTIAFTAMCRYIIPRVPGSKIRQWLVSDDRMEHHFRNMRGANVDNTNPRVSECCSASRHASVIRLLGDNSGNSGRAPAHEQDEYHQRSFYRDERPQKGTSRAEQIFHAAHGRFESASASSVGAGLLPGFEK